MPSNSESGPKTIATGPKPARKPRADGIRSREAILTAAAKLASVRGFESLSLGALAKHLGMSKSGLFAHFGSKEELELATIDAADRIFGERVLAKVQSAPPGLTRLWAVVDAFFGHVQSEYFPGGCFFAAVAAEVVAIPGRPRDRLLSCIGNWLALLGRCLDEGRARGEIRADADTAQLVFEVQAMLSAANHGFVVTRDPDVFRRAKASIAGILQRVAP